MQGLLHGLASLFNISLNILGREKWKEEEFEQQMFILLPELMQSWKKPH